jgi:hypothetical protein
MNWPLSVDDVGRAMARPLGMPGQQKRPELIGSQKMGHELRVESALEALTALALDIDPRIKTIKAQPFTARLDLMKWFPTKSEALAARPSVPPRSEREDPESVFVYTPDFCVTSIHPDDLAIESKPEAELDSINSEVVQWRAALNNLGFRFLVVTDRDLDAPGLRSNLVNIRDALQALSVGKGRTQLALLEAALPRLGKNFALADVRSHAPDSVILLAIAAGLLACDLRAGHLGRSTVLSPAYGDLSHLQLLDL